MDSDERIRTRFIRVVSNHTSCSCNHDCSTNSDVALHPPGWRRSDDRVSRLRPTLPFNTTGNQHSMHAIANFSILSFLLILLCISLLPSASSHSTLHSVSQFASIDPSPQCSQGFFGPSCAFTIADCQNCAQTYGASLVSRNIIFTGSGFDSVSGIQSAGRNVTFQFTSTTYLMPDGSSVPIQQLSFTAPFLIAPTTLNTTSSYVSLTFYLNADSISLDFPSTLLYSKSTCMAAGVYLNADGWCTACPSDAGAICYGGGILLPQVGYYLPAGDKSPLPWKCVDSQRCPGLDRSTMIMYGVNMDLQCSPDSTGLLCSDCAANYARFSYQAPCWSCGDDIEQIEYVIGAFLVVAAFIIFWSVIITRCSPLVVACATFSCIILQQCIAIAQTALSTPELAPANTNSGVYAVVHGMTYAVSLLSLLNFDVHGMKFGCSFLPRINFVESFALTFFYAIGFALLLQTAVQLHLACGCGSKAKRGLRRQALLVSGCLSYFRITTVMLNSFQCVSLPSTDANDPAASNDTFFLQWQGGLQCFVSTHLYITIFIGVVFICFTVGLPVIMFIRYVERKRLQQPQQQYAHMKYAMRSTNQITPISPASKTRSPLSVPRNPSDELRLTISTEMLPAAAEATTTTTGVAPPPGTFERKRRKSESYVVAWKIPGSNSPRRKSISAPADALPPLSLLQLTSQSPPHPPPAQLSPPTSPEPSAVEPSPPSSAVLPVPLPPPPPPPTPPCPPPPPPPRPPRIPFTIMEGVEPSLELEPAELGRFERRINAEGNSTSDAMPVVTVIAPGSRPREVRIPILAAAAPSTSAATTGPGPLPSSSSSPQLQSVIHSYDSFLFDAFNSQYRVSSVLYLCISMCILDLLVLIPVDAYSLKIVLVAAMFCLQSIATTFLLPCSSYAKSFFLNCGFLFGLAVCSAFLGLHANDAIRNNNQSDDVVAFWATLGVFVFCTATLSCRKLLPMRPSLETAVGKGWGIDEVKTVEEFSATHLLQAFDELPTAAEKKPQPHDMVVAPVSIELPNNVPQQSEDGYTPLFDPSNNSNNDQNASSAVIEAPPRRSSVPLLPLRLFSTSMSTNSIDSARDDDDAKKKIRPKSPPSKPTVVESSSSVESPSRETEQGPTFDRAPSLSLQSSTVSLSLTEEDEESHAISSSANGQPRSVSHDAANNQNNARFSSTLHASSAVSAPPSQSPAVPDADGLTPRTRAIFERLKHQAKIDEETRKADAEALRQEIDRMLQEEKRASHAVLMESIFTCKDAPFEVGNSVVQLALDFLERKGFLAAYGHDSHPYPPLLYLYDALLEAVPVVQRAREKFVKDLQIKVDTAKRKRRVKDLRETTMSLEDETTEITMGNPKQDPSWSVENWQETVSSLRNLSSRWDECLDGLMLSKCAAGGFEDRWEPLVGGEQEAEELKHILQYRDPAQRRWIEAYFHYHVMKDVAPLLRQEEMVRTKFLMEQEFAINSALEAIEEAELLQEATLIEQAQHDASQSVTPTDAKVDSEVRSFRVQMHKARLKTERAQTKVQLREIAAKERIRLRKEQEVNAVLDQCAAAASSSPLSSPSTSSTSLTEFQSKLAAFKPLPQILPRYKNPQADHAPATLPPLKLHQIPSEKVIVARVKPESSTSATTSASSTPVRSVASPMAAASTGPVESPAVRHLRVNTITEEDMTDLLIPAGSTSGVSHWTMSDDFFDVVHETKAGKEELIGAIQQLDGHPQMLFRTDSLLSIGEGHKPIRSPVLKSRNITPRAQSGAQSARHQETVAQRAARRSGAGQFTERFGDYTAEVASNDVLQQPLSPFGTRRFLFNEKKAPSPSIDRTPSAIRLAVRTGHFTAASDFAPLDGRPRQGHEKVNHIIDSLVEQLSHRKL